MGQLVEVALEIDVALKEQAEKVFAENTKCARLQGADGRKGNVSSIQMI